VETQISSPASRMAARVVVASDAAGVKVANLGSRSC
jgi:hypothetical protein